MIISRKFVESVYPEMETDWETNMKTKRKQKGVQRGKLRGKWIGTRRREAGRGGGDIERNREAEIDGNR